MSTQDEIYLEDTIAACLAKKVDAVTFFYYLAVNEQVQEAIAQKQRYT